MSDEVPTTSMPNLILTIITPCLNEEDAIGQCLDSIIANNFPKDQLEILIVDGRSEDRTREIVADYQKKHAFIRLIDNPDRIQQIALNLGIKAARGHYIIRLDARCTVEPNYFEICLKYIQETGADCVGAVVHPKAQYKTLIGLSTTFAITHPFGAGPGFRNFSKKNFTPITTHTAACGCYRRSVYDKVGYYDKKLPFCEDLDFHYRMRKAGCEILLIPETSSAYFVRGTLLSFIKHSYRNGLWAILPILYTKTIIIRPKHLVPLFFILTLTGIAISATFSSYGLIAFALIIGLYSGSALSIAAIHALRERNILYIFSIPLVFFSLHVGYGIGSVVGLIYLAWGTVIYSDNPPAFGTNWLSSDR